MLRLETPDVNSVTPDAWHGLLMHSFASRHLAAWEHLLNLTTESRTSSGRPGGSVQLPNFFPSGCHPRPAWTLPRTLGSALDNHFHLLHAGLGTPSSASRAGPRKTST